MTHYTNTIQGGLISAVDVTTTPDGAMAYIRVRDERALPAVMARLEAMGRHVHARTVVAGSPMLVTSGAQGEAELIAGLSAEGALVRHEEKKPFDAWKVRSLLGFGGQALQLTSSFMKHKVDVPLLIFASTNMTANGINLAYKAQQHDDPHQLRLLKHAINQRLAPDLPEGATALDVNDQRFLLREQGKPKVADPLHNFMQKNSVNVGELGLRYIGAFGMAFPASDWGKAMRERRLPVSDRRAPLRTVAGLGSILGKTIALTSKIPDPYNPAPTSAFERLREKYSFLAGGLVEAGAFSVLAFDAFFNTSPKGGDTSRSLLIRGKHMPDFISGIGSAMFVAGYIVRSWAKFGERKVNMPELYAHTSDVLAQLPPERIAGALADSAAYLADHFKGRPGLSFAVVYENLEGDLYRSHHIAVLPPIRGEAALAQPASALPGTQVQKDGLTHAAPNAPVMARTA